MTFTTTLSAFSIASLLCFNSFCQADTPELFRNRAALKDHPIAALENAYYNHFTEFEKLEFYYTESFEAIDVNCNCDADIDELINEKVFFVQNFEDLRESSNTHTFTYLNRYEITLLSQDEVNARYEFIETDTSINPMPEWADTGDDEADYNAYKIAINAWLRKYKSEYRSMIQAGLKQVQIEEFMSMSDDKKQQIMNHPQGYILYD